MKEAIWTLLAYGRADYAFHLRQVLEPLAKISDARTCKEAEDYLSQPNPPHLVFADALMPDGTWLDVLEFAKKAAEPVNVVVVAPVADFGLYIDALELDVLEIAGGIPAVGREQAVAQPHVPRREQGRHERRTGPVHAGDDQLQRQTGVIVDGVKNALHQPEFGAGAGDEADAARRTF